MKRQLASWLCLVGLGGCVEDVLLGRECPGPSCIDASMPILDAGHCAISDASSCLCEVSGTVVAHWPLDERSGTIADEVVGGRDGRLTHAPSQMPWVSGHLGGALNFDGADDAVDVGNVGSVRSLSFWIDPRTTQQVALRTGMLLPTAHGPLDEWSNPELAYADDDMAATVASLFDTSAQHWGGFHLAQKTPAAAEILGVTVTVDTGNLGLLGMLSVELSWDGGTTHTMSRYGWGQLIVGSNLRQAGGADKLWGRTWTASELSDANFRVRASFGGIVNSMALDYVGVEVEYAPQTLDRVMIGLRDGSYVKFSGNTLASVGWNASVFVNGAANGMIRDGWNHVAVVGPTLMASDVRLGAATLETLTVPFDGLLDDVVFFSEPLTAAQIQTLAQAPTCAR